MASKLLLASASVCMCAGALAGPTEDFIASLPGTKSMPSKQYSGYLDVSATKHMHYWFIEAETDPANAPLVLWLNGGPGCSSLDGLMYEHGPFRINASDPTKLMRFDYTWARVANMLYLEAPVGVGFSYSDDPKKDYACTDDTAANDNLKAVEAFSKKFPEHSKKDFFITGESYAGVYVPTLAEAIVWAAGNGTYSGPPLAGIAVGNGCTGTETGVCGGQRDLYDTEYLLGTAFVSNDLKTKIKKACFPWKTTLTEECASLIAEMGDAIGHVDLYNVYGPCISGSGAQLAGSGSATYKVPMDKTSKLFKHQTHPSLGVKAGSRGPDACIDSRLASDYLNRADVQKASHVKKPEERWATCGSAPGWGYKSTRPNLPRDTYPLLVQHMRVLVYNGDWDACVPYTDNEAWTKGMGYSVAEDWHAWQYQLDFEGETTTQVGGYATRYNANNFTFITIRGGRHEVPETAPDKAFAMITMLVNGQQF